MACAPLAEKVLGTDIEAPIVPVLLGVGFLVVCIGMHWFRFADKHGRGW
jgi:hypothetical protein